MDNDVLPKHKAVDLLLEIHPLLEGYAEGLAELCCYHPLSLQISASFLKEANIEVMKYLQELENERDRRLAGRKFVDKLRASIDASLQLTYNSFDKSTQTVFCHLSMFNTGFNYRAVEWVAKPFGNIKDFIDVLCRYGFVQRDEPILPSWTPQQAAEYINGKPWFVLHHVARKFGYSNLKNKLIAQFNYKLHLYAFNRRLAREILSVKRLLELTKNDNLLDKASRSRINLIFLYSKSDLSTNKIVLFELIAYILSHPRAHYPSGLSRFSVQQKIQIDVVSTVPSRISTKNIKPHSQDKPTDSQDTHAVDSYSPPSVYELPGSQDAHAVDSYSPPSAYELLRQIDDFLKRTDQLGAEEHVFSGTTNASKHLRFNVTKLKEGAKLRQWALTVSEVLQAENIDDTVAIELLRMLSIEPSLTKAQAAISNRWLCTQFLSELNEETVVLWLSGTVINQVRTLAHIINTEAAIFTDARLQLHYIVGCVFKPHQERVKILRSLLHSLKVPLTYEMISQKGDFLLDTDFLIGQGKANSAKLEAIGIRISDDFEESYEGLLQSILNEVGLIAIRTTLDVDGVDVVQYYLTESDLLRSLKSAELYLRLPHMTTEIV